MTNNAASSKSKEHRIPSRLAVATALSLTLLLAGCGQDEQAEQTPEEQQAAEERTEPVGQAQVGEEQPPAEQPATPPATEPAPPPAAGTEPPPPAAGTEPVPPPAETAPAPEAPAAGAEAPAAGGGDVALGKQVYDKACFACHGTGAAGAPKLGDATAWGPRIEKGTETLYQSAINGLRAMPPRGTCMQCTDEELMAAVDFMVSQAQQ